MVSSTQNSVGQFSSLGFPLHTEQPGLQQTLGHMLVSEAYATLQLPEGACWQDVHGSYVKLMERWEAEEFSSGQNMYADYRQATVAYETIALSKSNTKPQPRRPSSRADDLPFLKAQYQQQVLFWSTSSLRVHRQSSMVRGWCVTGDPVMRMMTVILCPQPLNCSIKTLLAGPLPPSVSSNQGPYSAIA